MGLVKPTYDVRESVRLSLSTHAQISRRSRAVCSPLFDGRKCSCTCRRYTAHNSYIAWRRRRQQRRRRMSVSVACTSNRIQPTTEIAETKSAAAVAVADAMYNNHLNQVVVFFAHTHTHRHARTRNANNTRARKNMRKHQFTCALSAYNITTETKCMRDRRGSLYVMHAHVRCCEALR